jgi:hypothetical protein
LHVNKNFNDLKNPSNGVQIQKTKKQNESEIAGIERVAAPMSPQANTWALRIYQDR